MGREFATVAEAMVELSLISPHRSRGRTGFDRMARGSDCVSWLVGWPR